MCKQKLISWVQQLRHKQVSQVPFWVIVAAALVTERSRHNFPKGFS